MKWATWLLSSWIKQTHCSLHELSKISLPITWIKQTEKWQWNSHFANCVFHEMSKKKPRIKPVLSKWLNTPITSAESHPYQWSVYYSVVIFICKQNFFLEKLDLRAYFCYEKNKAKESTFKNEIKQFSWEWNELE